MAEKNRYVSKEELIVLNSFTEADLRILKQHEDIKSVNIWLEGLAIPNLDFLLNCMQLESVSMYGGKVGDYSALGKLPKLKSIFLNGRLRRWTENLDFLRELRTLESLMILNYPMISCFPDLHNLVNLINVEIWDCKRLVDIAAVTLIPNLQTFVFVGTSLNADDLEFIAKKPGIKTMGGMLGSNRKNDAFKSMLKKYGIENVWREG